jgi:iron complex transport system substrate-binding protein
VLAIAAAALLTVGAVFAAACGDDDSPSPTQSGASASAAGTTTAASTTTAATTGTAAATDAFANVPGIVDPSNHGWPREVEGLNGKVTIEQKPERVTTMSAGLDEITLGLVPVSRVVGVGSATQNPAYSVIADEAKGIKTIGRDPESVASVDPDLVIASPTQKADVVSAIAALNIPVVQLDLDPTPEGRIQTIKLLGYIYGEEDRAIELANEVQKRYDAVVSVTSKIPESDKPVVLAVTKATQISIAGTGTTHEGIIEAAGGINAGTKMGVTGNATSSIEGMVAANPDVIVLIGTDDAEAFKTELMNTAAMAEVPAVKDGKIYIVPLSLYSTNSFQNVRAVEQLAHILWPSDFPVADPPAFTLPTGQ